MYKLKNGSCMATVMQLSHLREYPFEIHDIIPENDAIGQGKFETL